MLILHGGPGATCDYVRDSHCVLADQGYRVVVFDQLGSGQSDKPKDTSLWRVERFVEEVEAVRVKLKLGRVHLLGQSWGTWLGTEYCL
ncbi:MAG: alpha/beta fold hydrolase [Alphaproteobacteria bacterium]